ncbi:hypothetical protein [Streptomyces sp. NBC_00572]|uniref:hypothetical protein n=1 Tax=Streptomyces sp. NBC_00572 TaxID=2903664 RepID=UPI002257399A|nr:hypothetical protein [Streptomyces sp. NBC_00572]MCX4986306.1 hypothetical protein [Streptomyces sp. NBC_00572]
MSGHFTDRDERMWQQRAEERAARPLPVGAWLRRALRTPRTETKAAPAPVRARPVEQP